METVHVKGRLVNKCMSTHLNANANVSLDSNANAIFQERIQMQMFWGRTQIQTQMFWLYICKCICINLKCVGFILTFCFISRKNNVMYKLLIYLVNTVVHFSKNT